MKLKTTEPDTDETDNIEAEHPDVQLPSYTRFIRIEKLVPGNNPRGDTGDVSDLLESFAYAPMLHNIVVRPIHGTGTFEIIAGHRRVHAARLKGIRQIEVKVIDVDDDTAEQLAHEENLARRALDDEATRYHRLVELRKVKNPTKRGGDRRSKAFQESKRHGSKLNAVGEVAKTTGQSERTVYRKAKIGNATATLKRAHASGKIGANDAEKIAGLPREQQARAVSALVRTRKTAPATGWPVEVHRALEALQHAERLVRKQIANVPTTAARKIFDTATSLVKLVGPRAGLRRRA